MGHDLPHAQAGPHDHGFWQGVVCPVCRMAATPQRPGWGVVPEFPGRRAPTAADRADPRFEVIWSLLRQVDVQFGNGTRSGATGDDVCAVLDALDRAVRGQPSCQQDILDRFVWAGRSRMSWVQIADGLHRLADGAGGPVRGSEPT